MRRFICVLVILATPLLASADDAKEWKGLQGKWKMVSAEAGGTPFPKEAVPDFSIVIAADGKSKVSTPDGEYQVTLTIDSKKQPKTMNTFHDSGPEKGKKQYGIYKVDGDKFTVSISRAGAEESERPKEFTSKDGTNVVFVFERVKETKKP